MVKGLVLSEIRMLADETEVAALSRVAMGVFGGVGFGTEGAASSDPFAVFLREVEVAIFFLLSEFEGSSGGVGVREGIEAFS